jgi:hypothetical protein
MDVSAVKSGNMNVNKLTQGIKRVVAYTVTGGATVNYGNTLVVANDYNMSSSDKLTVNGEAYFGGDPVNNTSITNYTYLKGTTVTADGGTVKWAVNLPTVASSIDISGGEFDLIGNTYLEQTSSGAIKLTNGAQLKYSNGGLNYSGSEKDKYAFSLGSGTYTFNGGGNLDIGYISSGVSGLKTGVSSLSTSTGMLTVTDNGTLNLPARQGGSTADRTEVTLNNIILNLTGKAPGLGGDELDSTNSWYSSQNGTSQASIILGAWSQLILNNVKTANTFPDITGAGCITTNIGSSLIDIGTTKTGKFKGQISSAPCQGTLSTGAPYNDAAAKAAPGFFTMSGTGATINNATYFYQGAGFGS